jgi:hypothetical protein
MRKDFLWHVQFTGVPFFISFAQPNNPVSETFLQNSGAMQIVGSDV